MPGQDQAARNRAGVVHVLRGTASGLTGINSPVFQQANNGVGDFPHDDDFFGQILAAGDFNDDGRADLAVGVFFEDAGTVEDAGVVHVIPGGPSGLTGAGSQLFRQGTGGLFGTAQAGDFFGRSLAPGDYDGDGRTDLAIGVPFQLAGGADGAGQVHVLYSGPAGLSGDFDQVFVQGSGGVAGTPEPSDAFGLALAAGDFDGDGRSDLAVGVPFEHAGGFEDAGVVQVLNGTADGLTGLGSQLFRQGVGGVGDVAEDRDSFGWALTAGRFNSGTQADLAIGVIGESTGAAVAGAVQALYGSTGGLTGTGSQLFRQGLGGVGGTPESGDSFGWAVAAS